MEIILAGRPDGLGARILNILNASIIAEKRGAGIKILWNKNKTPHNYEGGLSDIFSGNTLDNFEIILRRDWEKTIDLYKTAQNLIYYDEIGRLPSDFIGITEAMHCEMSMRHFKKLELNNSLSKVFGEIDSWFTNPLNQNVESVHVRAGDVTKKVARYFGIKYYPIEFYEELIKQLSIVEERPLIVLSNDVNQLEKLKNRFNLISVTDVVDCAHLNSLQRDFVELYIISRSKVVYGPRRSAFGIAASRIGRTNLVDVGEKVIGIELTKCIKNVILTVQSQCNSTNIE